MPLINPVYGLPNYNVERLSESESKNRQRDRQKNKKEEDSQSKDIVSKDEPSQSDGGSSLDALETSQPLDTETVVKLLEDQLKNKNTIENQTLKVSNRYDHVKKLTDDVKINREI